MTRTGGAGQRAVGTTNQGKARLAREWNMAFVLVAVVAVLLASASHVMAGIATGAVCVVAVLVRAVAMRRQGRGFYGQELGEGT